MPRVSWRLSAAEWATMAWGAWVVEAGFILAIDHLSIAHPPFPPVLLPLGVQIIAALALLVGAARRCCLRSSRARALAWVLVGTVPLWLNAAHFNYGLWKFTGRDVHSGWALRTAGVLGASFLDLGVRILLPYAHEGKNCVMWTDRPEGDPLRVAAMDEHIERMERLLGRRCKARVYWVRSDYGGTSACSFLGWVIGTPLAQGAPSKELSWIDRHEAAHFVVDEIAGLSVFPPAILMEGWAEAQTGYPPPLGWRLYEREDLLSLEELVSPSWVGRHLPPAYDQGAVLVDYLLRRYGGHTFLELFRTASRSNFDADCRRVLGISLRELDEAYRADIVKQLKPRSLDSARLGAGVDPKMWHELIAGRTAATAALRDRIRRVRVEARVQSTWRDADGQLRRQERSVKAACHEPWGTLERTENGWVSCFVVGPRLSFSLGKTTDADGWAHKSAGMFGFPPYDTIAFRHEVRSGIHDCLAGVLQEPLWRAVWAEEGITSIDSFQEDGRELWRVGYAHKNGRGGGSIVFWPAGDWALQSSESQWYDDGGAFRRDEVKVRYRTHAGGNPQYSGSTEIHWDEKGETSRHEVEIGRLEFGDTPPQSFSPQAFALEESDFPKPGPPWQVLLTVWGSALSLSIGLLLLALMRPAGLNPASGMTQSTG